jgi:hypothetical protein
MFRACVIAALLCSPVVLAGTVNDEFANGVLDLKWGATLQQVQAKYPKGRTWPTAQVRETTLAYDAPVDIALLGLEERAVTVMFHFARFGDSERLTWISIHFDYEDRDAVLYKLADKLGQDYSVHTDREDSYYEWKRPRASQVSLRIGNAPPYSWAIVAISEVE